jgi:transcriptional regulator with GAF, ATPase, and Fis domain
MCVPLRLHERIVGTVYLDSRSGDTMFTQEDVRFAEAFADHAGLALHNARERERLELENVRLREQAENHARYENIIGESPAMREVFALIGKVAESELPVLIQGESGTGKELVAKAIHFHGPRREQTFLTENCASIPESLLESELFGHVRGAFTGAERNRVGLFEEADRGTLFLDEVGDMTPAMQARLLRVLQEGEIRRVGGDRPISVDVRVIAASHRDLDEEVAAGRFREDLLYRLKVLVVRIPPLRERSGDIELLVDFMSKRIAEERGREAPRIATEVIRRFERYPWPGNVRQLQNVVQRLSLLAGSGPIDVAMIESDRELSRLFAAGRSAEQAPFSLQANERERIRAALRQADGNRNRAAKLLGISRATIYRKIKEYGLH